MAVLVTGATGFLGSTLVAALHRQSADVVATGRNAARLQRLADRGVRTIVADLAHPVPSCVADQMGAVETVVHCAGLSSPWGTQAAFEAANVDGTRNIADLSGRLGASRLIMISTASVYFRFADQADVTEAAALPDPVNNYVRTKILAEQEVLARADLNPVVLRPRGIYGAGDTSLLPRLMRVAARGVLPRFSPMGATDVTHVDDVVAAIQCAMDAGPEVNGQVMNVSGGVAIEMTQVIDAACCEMGVVPRWRAMPFAPVMWAARLAEGVACALPRKPEPPVTAYALGLLRYRQTSDLSKAARLLRWHPQVGFADGLARTFQNGQLRPGAL